MNKRKTSNQKSIMKKYEYKNIDIDTNDVTSISDVFQKLQDPWLSKVEKIKKIRGG